MKRSPLRRTRDARDWTDARAKVDREAACRAGGWLQAECSGRLEAAHVIGRAHDALGPRGVPHVDPEHIVPLCQAHHRAYDARQLDLLPYLTLAEQAAAVRLVGIVRATERVSGGRPLRAGSPVPTPQQEAHDPKDEA